MAALGLVVGLVSVACGHDGGEAAEAGERSGGWELTVYYTAVEQFHDGPIHPVTGCPRLDCEAGDDDLGRYPADFVDAVRAEGTGRITSGPHAGGYLNWSHDVGYWLDTAPRDSRGEALRPFRSAAADPGVLPAGTRFRVLDCGHADDGSQPPPSTCRRITDARWTVVDEFTPGLGGDRHLDLYIGEETGPGFTDSELSVSLVDARLAVRP